MSSKQDRSGIRTFGDLEYKYGKSFAEAMGIATDAQKKAEEVEKKINGNMTNEEIFKMLTNGGVNQGLFRYEDGELYINAEYLQVIDAIFAHNINMTGKFTYKTKVFLEPGQEEVDTIKKHYMSFGEQIIPSRIALYDFNNDGVVDNKDYAAAKMAMQGEQSLADWSGAVESDVTLTIDLKNPNKAIHMIGTNMWGREIDTYIGIGTASINNVNVADYIVESGASMDGWTYRLWSSGLAECWWTEYCTFTPDQLTAWGETYMSPEFGAIPYPTDKFTFLSVPNEIKQISGSIGALSSYWLSQLGNVSNTKTESGKWFFSRPLSATKPTTDLSLLVSIYAVGQWK